VSVVRNVKDGSSNLARGARLLRVSSDVSESKERESGNICQVNEACVLKNEERGCAQLAKHCCSPLEPTDGLPEVPCVSLCWRSAEWIVMKLNIWKDY
jgi:hypothetical protein